MKIISFTGLKNSPVKNSYSVLTGIDIPDKIIDKKSLAKELVYSVFLNKLKNVITIVQENKK